MLGRTEHAEAAQWDRVAPPYGAAEEGGGWRLSPCALAHVGPYQAGASLGALLLPPSVGSE